MTLGALIFTIIELILLGNYIYKFVPAEGVERFREDLQKTHLAFKLMPSLDFFLRFLIQIIFVSSVI
jgi:hypothetical protein